MLVAVCFLLAGQTPPLHHKLLRKYLLPQPKVSDLLYPNPLWWPPVDISEAGYEEWRHLEWHLDWILQSEVLAQMQARTMKRMPQLTLQSKVEHLFIPFLVIVKVLACMYLPYSEQYQSISLSALPSQICKFIYKYWFHIVCSLIQSHQTTTLNQWLKGWVMSWINVVWIISLNCK